MHAVFVRSSLKASGYPLRRVPYIFAGCQRIIAGFPDAIFGLHDIDCHSR
jgi:hypothetical protein